MELVSRSKARQIMGYHKRDIPRGEYKKFSKIEDLKEFVNESRIVDITEYGNIIFTFESPNDRQFYSADEIDDLRKEMHQLREDYESRIKEAQGDFRRGIAICYTTAI